MDNSITEKSPAKINLFLKIINRREDNYHNIRTGITSINLCDEIEVNRSDQFNVNYKGPFAPENNKFDDCIIKKIFSFLNIPPPNISFSITKNFPYQAGLGSASSNAATVIKILENLEIINKKNIFDGILFLHDKGIENVYVTGELKKGKIRNHLYSKGELVNIDEVPKMKNIIHGSGCALSTSILCFLANKKSLKEACSKSQNLMRVLVKNSRNHIHQNILKIQ